DIGPVHHAVSETDVARTGMLDGPTRILAPSNAAMGHQPDLDLLRRANVAPSCWASHLGGRGGSTSLAHAARRMPRFARSLQAARKRSSPTDPRCRPGDIGTVKCGVD